jgi:hypothetical protein
MDRLELLHRPKLRSGLSSGSRSVCRKDLRFVLPGTYYGQVDEWLTCGGSARSHDPAVADRRNCEVDWRGWIEIGLSACVANSGVGPDRRGGRGQLPRYRRHDDLGPAAGNITVSLTSDISGCLQVRRCQVHKCTALSEAKRSDRSYLVLCANRKSHARYI